MVQITFAFVIILGYLISVGMDETQDLAAENEARRQKNLVLESIVVDLSKTALGKERRARVVAQRKQQLERLLRVWAEIRVERRLYRLLRQFEYAEFIPLSDDVRSLPTGRSFIDLTLEIDRVFLGENAEVASKEVFLLMREVLTKAGFDVRSEDQLAVAGSMSAEAYASYFNDSMPTMDNLRMLKLQIVDDLQKDRDSLVELQYTLVGKIAAARLDRLAALPLDVSGGSEETESDPATAMLDQILEDLRTSMRLLPETAARIRGTSGRGDEGETE